MPRFLDTSTGEFEWHNDPRHVAYAILSHTWRSPEDGGEQSYDEVQALQVAVAEEVRREQVPVMNELRTFTSLQPSVVAANRVSHSLHRCSTRSSILSHPKLSHKVKGICKVARKAGFRLVWNDACCIDKSSSAELSEAINSMYDWFRLSDMCYVYLQDVPDGDRPQDTQSDFRKSRWHTRGWTLQELIAPECVEFLTNTWHFLGTKTGLAPTLEWITGVDFNILTRRATLDSVSVARRMSWAAERETTRVEDRAYCLMGIFGIHMSPIYGDGENAFLRLQEEVIRTIPDQSIFAWGVSGALWLSDWRFSAESDGNLIWPNEYTDSGLLANSPTPFSQCASIIPVSSSRLAHIVGLRQSEIPPLHCVFTPEGVNVRLICLYLAGTPHILDTFQEQLSMDPRTTGRRLQLRALALLQCQHKHGHLVALPLYRSRGEGGCDSASLIGQWSHEPYLAQAVYLESSALVETLKHVRPTVEEVTLLRNDSHPPIPKSLQERDDLPFLDFWPWYGLSKVAIEIAPHSITPLDF